MQCDIVFILRGYPAEYRFHDRHYFMFPVAEGTIDSFRQLGKKFPALRAFFGERPAAEFTAIGFRFEAKDQDEAHELAEDHLARLLDGLAVLLDHQIPKRGPLLLIRQGNDADAGLFFRGGVTWIYMNPRDPTSAETWKRRNEQLFRALFPFFDLAAGVHPRRDTSLARQLLYSMKMFRQGAESGIYGVEFICKWCALEGLVCAGQEGKRLLLCERIPSLFPEAERVEVLETVERLWPLRHEAVHEARAGESLSVEIGHVERLFAAVIVFALAHLDRADDLRELWAHASGYVLPEFARQKRTSDLARFAVTRFLENPHLVLKGFGTLIDDAFKRVAQVTTPTSPSDHGVKSQIL